jgi:sugar phosphate isomerase/epimerase
MRLRHPDGQLIHLSYCTNVHPAEDLSGILAQLDTYGAAVRRRLDADVLGLGLWLAAPVAAGLMADPSARRSLRRELDARGLEVVTLNGFPYRSFQAPVVKQAVYQPDWTSRQRLEYTLNLAWILADLLPGDAARGSVSTLPLAWRQPWDASSADQAARLLHALSLGLHAVTERTGRTIRVGFEPEPGCVVETSAQAVSALRDVDTERLGICLDLAHVACAWEDPAQVLARLAEAGLPVVKVQVSAALEVEDPIAARQTLNAYVEQRFLHQTRNASGLGTDDLDVALADRLPGPWRVHYHVPVHAQPIPPLATTVPVLRSALDALVGGPIASCDHFDVETYTWEVLPDRRGSGAGTGRPRSAAELADGIAAELAFARDELCARGLSAVTGQSVENRA